MVSPGASASGFAPVSTLIPGTMPRLASTCASGRPRGALLSDRLVLHDDATDRGGGVGRREQQFPIRAPALLGGADAERFEPLGQRARGLVGGQDALAIGDQSPRGAHGVLIHRSIAPLRAARRGGQVSQHLQPQALAQRVQPVRGIGGSTPRSACASRPSLATTPCCTARTAPDLAPPRKVAKSRSCRCRPASALCGRANPDGRSGDSARHRAEPHTGWWSRVNAGAS